MIDWNALHAACVERITDYEESYSLCISIRATRSAKVYFQKARRYEALLEFIDTRIQTSINQPV